MAEADRIARGESPRDAAANARREFGNVGLVQEVARDEWNGAGLAAERLGQDRALRGADAAPGARICRVRHRHHRARHRRDHRDLQCRQATLIHPLPYPHPEQLVRIEDDLVGIGARDVGMSTPEWHDLQRSGVFTHVAPAWFDNNNLTGISHPQRVALDDRRTQLFRAARREAAARRGVRPVGSDAGVQRPGHHQRRALERLLRRRPAHSRPRRAARLRFVSHRRCHAAALSVARARRRGTAHASVGGIRVRRCAAAPIDRHVPKQSVPGSDCANRAGPDPRPSPTTRRRVRPRAPTRIPGRLSAAQRLARPPRAAQGRRRGRRSTTTGVSARRRRTGAARSVAPMSRICCSPAPRHEGARWRCVKRSAARRRVSCGSCSRRVWCCRCSAVSSASRSSSSRKTHSSGSSPTGPAPQRHLDRLGRARVRIPGVARRRRAVRSRARVARARSRRHARVEARGPRLDELARSPTHETPARRSARSHSR